MRLTDILSVLAFALSARALPMPLEPKLPETRGDLWYKARVYVGGNAAQEKWSGAQIPWEERPSRHFRGSPSWWKHMQNDRSIRTRMLLSPEHGDAIREWTDCMHKTIPTVNPPIDRTKTPGHIVREFMSEELPERQQKRVAELADQCIKTLNDAWRSGGEQYKENLQRQQQEREKKGRGLIPFLATVRDSFLRNGPFRSQTGSLVKPDARAGFGGTRIRPAGLRIGR